jgi:hypothetical protein
MVTKSAQIVTQPTLLRIFRWPKNSAVYPGRWQVVLGVLRQSQSCAACGHEHLFITQGSCVSWQWPNTYDIPLCLVCPPSRKTENRGGKGERGTRYLQAHGKVGRFVASAISIVADKHWSITVHIRKCKVFIDSFVFPLPLFVGCHKGEETPVRRRLRCFLASTSPRETTFALFSAMLTKGLETHRRFQY